MRLEFVSWQFAQFGEFLDLNVRSPTGFEGSCSLPELVDQPQTPRRARLAVDSGRLPGEFFPIRQYVKRTSGLLRAIGNDHEAQAARNDS
jgi:hypothetical protein